MSTSIPISEISTFSLLVLEKSGTLHEKNVKNLDRLYTLCNYRSEEGFEELHSWNQPNNSTFYLYGKRKGKNNYENSCVLPQPIHQETFYGNLCIVKKVGELPQSLTINEWNKFLENKEEELKPELKELKKEEYEPEP